MKSFKGSIKRTFCPSWLLWEHWLQIVDVQYNLNENIGVLTSFLTMSCCAFSSLAELARVPILVLGESGGFSGRVEDTLSRTVIGSGVGTFPFRKGDDKVIGVVYLFSTTFLVLWRVGLLLFLSGSTCFLIYNLF